MGRMYCSGEISGDLPRVMKLEGRVTQETYSLHCICLLPKIQLKYVTVGRENDENWNGISEIGTVSEMWSLKGRNSAVAFYNEPSIQSCKARQSWKVRGCLWGKVEIILGAYMFTCTFTLIFFLFHFYHNFLVRILMFLNPLFCCTHSYKIVFTLLFLCFLLQFRGK